MIDKPKIRADNMFSNLVIRNANEPQQEPIVLLGRRADELDIGLAFHAYERARELAFSLDGFRRTPFSSLDREKRFETLVSILIEFAVSARRYLDLVSDDELENLVVSKTDGLNFRFALNRLVHGVSFIPMYRQAEAEIGNDSDRDTIASGVQVRTKERELADIGLAEICHAFLNHHPAALFVALDRYEQSAKIQRDQAVLNSEKK